ncbi:NUDIX domain-containing protein [Streptomyces sp. NPDC048507]|uniref:NUDIX domain-containing protein n=1 Tax=Streptomyces sp. NPDC048507 TaxID=3365560 RepID=UPI003715FA8B
MTEVNLRHAVRALVLDPADRLLLCRFVLPGPAGPFVVWAAPGGGVEPGETLLGALARELDEEVGLAVTGAPPHVWHQEILDPGISRGHDGVVNDYFLVRTGPFAPRGRLDDAALAAENMHGLRWWPLREVVEYEGPDLFSPRDLATPLTALLRDGVPRRPVRLGL